MLYATTCLIDPLRRSLGRAYKNEKRKEKANRQIGILWIRDYQWMGGELWPVWLAGVKLMRLDN